MNPNDEQALGSDLSGGLGVENEDEGLPMTSSRPGYLSKVQGERDRYREALTRIMECADDDRETVWEMWRYAKEALQDA